MGCISKYMFALFALFVIFADEVFFSAMYISGTSLVSGMKAYEAIIIAVVAYYLLICDIVKKQLVHENKVQLFVLLTLMFLFYITGQVYFPSVSLYWSNFLAYVAMTIPACYVGMALARKNVEEQIMKIFPFFLIVIILTVSSVVGYSASVGYLLKTEEDVFSYQNSSYYLSFCFSYCFAYVFLIRKRNRFLKIVLFLLMFICAIGCLLGGGRGGFVYLIAISVFLAFRFMNRGKGGVKIFRFILIIVVVALAIFMTNYFHVFESIGATRVAERLTTDENRMIMWNNAIHAFEESPVIGHGVGSIWWTVGFYSHNILTDLLAETGLIGTLLVVYVLITIMIRMMKRSKEGVLDMFILLVFLGGIVHSCFSGYWLTAPKLFLAYGYAFGLHKNRINKRFGNNALLK